MFDPVTFVFSVPPSCVILYLFKFFSLPDHPSISSGVITVIYISFLQATLLMCVTSVALMWLFWRRVQNNGCVRCCICMGFFQLAVWALAFAAFILGFLPAFMLGF